MKLSKLWDIQWPMSPGMVEAINANFDFLFRRVSQASTASGGGVSGSAGPAGPEGPTGPTGPAGPQGSTGSTGSSGAFGSVTGVLHQVVVTGTLLDPILGTPQNIDTDSDVQHARLGLGVAPEAGSALKLAGHGYYVQVDAGNGGAAKTIDWSTGNEQILVLTANCTLTFSNPKAGGRYVLRLQQDGTGSWTVTWPGTVVWSGGVAPTITSTPSALILVAFYFDGTNYIGAGSNASALVQGLPEVPLSVPHGGTGLYSAAKGTLLVGSGADGAIALAKLAVGTNGQVVTADSTAPDGIAWATLLSARCSASLTSDTTASVNTPKLIDFGTEAYDVGGFHSTITNPSRFTVPAGYDGLYLITVGIGWGELAVGSFYLRFYKNGNFLAEDVRPGSNVGSPLTSNQMASLQALLVAGDYIEVTAMFAYNVGSADMAIAAGATRTFLQLARIG